MINFEFERLKVAEGACTNLALLGLACSAIYYDLTYPSEIEED